MKISNISKQDIFEHIKKALEKSEHDTKQLIQQTKESRNSESKSTAGDKHETSRATTQHEIDKYEAQLNMLHQQLVELSQINIHVKNNVVAKGSLVTTNKELFFIGIGLGKLIIGGVSVFSISTSSPIGKALLGKRVKDVCKVLSNEYQIEALE